MKLSTTCAAENATHWPPSPAPFPRATMPAPALRGPLHPSRLRLLSHTVIQHHPKLAVSHQATQQHFLRIFFAIYASTLGHRAQGNRCFCPLVAVPFRKRAASIITAWNVPGTVPPLRLLQYRLFGDTFPCPAKLGPCATPPAGGDCERYSS